MEHMGPCNVSKENETTQGGWVYGVGCRHDSNTTPRSVDSSRAERVRCTPPTPGARPTTPSRLPPLRAATPPFRARHPPSPGPARQSGREARSMVAPPRKDGDDPATAASLADVVKGTSRDALWYSMLCGCVELLGTKVLTSLGFEDLVRS
ncbi:hypothetical protein KM043_011923 [Ampulex compressa]|nr:hypothetical protein KM043_011923 [Ampulex compressa]